MYSATAGGKDSLGDGVDITITTAESLFKLLGWEKRDIREQLLDTRDATLGAWG